MFRAALAGPGPATMAYRTRLWSQVGLISLQQRAQASSKAKASGKKNRPRQAPVDQPLTKVDVPKQPTSGHLGVAGTKLNAASVEPKERDVQANASKVRADATKGKPSTATAKGQPCDSKSRTNSPKGKAKAAKSKGRPGEVKGATKPAGKATAPKGKTDKTGKKEAQAEQPNAKANTAGTKKAAAQQRRKEEPLVTTFPDPPAAIHDQENIIYLPPPADHIDVDGLARKTIGCFKKGNLKGVTTTWQKLLDTQTAQFVSEKDLGELSAGLVSLLNGRDDQMLRRLSFEDTEAFGILRHLAIETAAHDKWQGLYEFLLELLNGGQPALASGTWQDFMKRAREVQGKQNIKALSSTNRVERVAARLDGEGMLPLILVQVATLTMMDQFDHSAVMTFLGTKAGVHADAIRGTDYQPIRKRLEGHGSRNRFIFRRFKENIEALILSVVCYHPKALIGRISTLSSVGDDGDALHYLYHRIMQASIAPHRFIIPITSDKFHYDVVPLPPAVWMKFMSAFARLGHTHMVLRMINEDAPARYPSTPTLLLGCAMNSLAYPAAYNWTLRVKTRKQIDEIWQRIIDRGEQDDPHMLRDRLRALHLLQATKDSHEFYAYAKAELRRRQVPNGDTYIDPVQFGNLCFSRKLQEALALLDDHRCIDSLRGTRHAFSDFIRYAVGNHMPLPDRRQLLMKVMQIKPERVRVSPGSYGHILAFLLEGGLDIDVACAQIAKKCGRYMSVSFYGPLIRNLINSKDESSDVQLEAAVHLLEHHFPQHAVVTATSFRVFSTWLPVAKFVAMSTVIPGHRRHELLERMAACYPQNEVHQNIHMLYLAIARSSVDRPTPDGVPEALYWWSKVGPGQARAHNYKTMVSGLARHGYLQIAGEIVDTLKPSPSTQQIIDLAESLGVPIGAKHGDVEPLADKPDSLESREEQMDDPEGAEELADEDSEAELAEVDELESEEVVDSQR